MLIDGDGPMARIILIIALSLCSLRVSANGTMLMQAEWLLEDALIRENKYANCCAAQAVTATVDILALPLLGFSLCDLLTQNRFKRANQNRVKVKRMGMTAKSLKKLIRFLNNLELAYFDIKQTAKGDQNVLNRYDLDFQLALNRSKKEGESDVDAIKRIYKINNKGIDGLDNLEMGIDYFGMAVSQFNKPHASKKENHSS